MSQAIAERRGYAGASPVGYHPSVADRVRIAGAKETRMAFGDALDRVQAGERAIIMQRTTPAFVLVSIQMYDRITDLVGEPPRGERMLLAVAHARGTEWTPMLDAIAAGKHVTVLRNSRPSAVAIPPVYYNRFLAAAGEPELALD